MAPCQISFRADLILLCKNKLYKKKCCAVTYTTQNTHLFFNVSACKLVTWKYLISLLFQKYLFYLLWKGKQTNVLRKSVVCHDGAWICVRNIVTWSHFHRLFYQSFEIRSSERLIWSRSTKRPCRQLSASLNNETFDRAFQSSLSFRHLRRKAARARPHKWKTKTNHCSILCHHFAIKFL